MSSPISSFRCRKLKCRDGARMGANLVNNDAKKAYMSVSLSLFSENEEIVWRPKKEEELEESKGPVSLIFSSATFSRHTTANKILWCIPPTPFSPCARVVFFWAIVFFFLCSWHLVVKPPMHLAMRRSVWRRNKRAQWEEDGLPGRVGAAGCLSFTRRSRDQSRLGTGQRREAGGRQVGKEQKERRRKRIIERHGRCPTCMVIHVDPTGLQASERLAAKECRRRQRPFVHQQVKGAGAEFCAGSAFAAHEPNNRPWRRHDFCVM